MNGKTSKDKVVTEMVISFNLGVNENDIEELLDIVPEELTNEELLEVEEEYMAEEEAREKASAIEKKELQYTLVKVYCVYSERISRSFCRTQQTPLKSLRALAIVA